MSTNNSPIDRRIKKSRTSLKEALLTLMQQKEFKEISITDIVQEADLNRGTFYNHYQYKEDLLEDIIDDVISDLVSSYRDPYQDSEIFELKNLSSSAIKVFEHVAKFSTFYTLAAKSKTLTGFQYKVCDILRNLSLQDLEESSPNPNINRELFASYHAYAILGMIIEWIDGEFKYNAAYMAEQLLEILKSNPINAIYIPNIHPNDR